MVIRKTEQMRSGNIFVFLILLYCIAVLIPNIFRENYSLVLVMLILVWFLFAIVKGLLNSGDGTIKCSKEDLKLIVVLICWFALIILYRILRISSAEWGNYMNTICFFSPVLMMLFVKKYMSLRQKKILANGILLIIVIGLADGIILISESIDPTSVNTVALLSFDACLFLFLNSRNVKKKIWYLIIMAEAFFYIVFCGMRGSVVIFLLLSIFLIIFSRFFNQKTTKTIWFVLLAILFLLMIFFSESILIFLISITNSERLVARFRDLLNVLQKGLTENSLSGRWGLIMLSLQTFCRNFNSILVGIGDHRYENTFGLDGYYASGIGGHSEFIDTLARYGVLGAIITIVLFYLIYKNLIKKQYNKSYRFQILSIALVFLMIGFTKGLYLPNIGIISFLLFPLLPELLVSNYEINKE